MRRRICSRSAALIFDGLDLWIALNDRIARDLETICLKAMAKEPGRRYASAALLAEDLRRFVAGQPVWARPVGRVERLRRWCRRNPAPAAALGLAVVAVLAVAALAVSYVFAVQQARAAERLRQEQEQTRAALLEAREQRAVFDSDSKLL